MRRRQFWDPFQGKPLFHHRPRLNPDHPLTRDLARWWLIREGVGITLYDIVKSCNLSMIGTVPWHKTAKGPAVGVFSTSNYFSRADSLITAPPLTMACWAYPTDLSAYQVVMSLGNNGTYGWYILAIRPPAGSNHIYATSEDDAGTSASAETSNAAVINTWNHIVFISGATNSRYAALNGSISAEETTNITNPTIDYQTIGARRVSAVGGPFAGYISDVGIWTRALTPMEVMELYLNPYGEPSNPRILIELKRTWFVPTIPSTTLAPTTLAPTTVIIPTTLPPTSLAPTSLAPTTMAPINTAPFPIFGGLIVRG